jgi:hypothetical protein
VAKTIHFRSMSSYHRWLGAEKYFTHGKKSKHPKKVVIAGRVHKVNHSK